MRLQLSIWAEGLKNTSTFATPDPFAVVTVLHKEPGVRPTLLGKTEVIENTNAPDWTKIFLLDDYELGAPTHIVVSIYDANKNSNTAMGATTFEVGSVLGAKGNIAAKELKTGGVCVAHIEEASASGMLEFQLRGLKFTNTEGMGLRNKSDPFFEFQRLRRSVADGRRVWDCVFRSAAITNDLSPIWSEGSIELSVLCGGNTQQKNRLVVYDYESNGKHDLMGSVQVSVDELVAGVNAFPFAKDPNTDKALTITKAGEETGKILIAMAKVTGVQDKGPVEEGVEVEATGAVVEQEPEQDIEIVVAADDEDIQVEAADFERPTFVNYIAGGCKLHVIAAIDATASNGDPRQPMSLHYFKGDGNNDYENALSCICEILSQYDSDQKYPVYGFGAKRDGALSHCFQIGSNPEVDGVEGITKAYSDAFKAGMTMSSPRDFSGVLEAAGKHAKAEMENGQAYSVLLIFTNGCPADSEKTLAMLKTVDDAPLSVVIVGVGEGDFTKVEALVESHKSSGCRDSVRFVNYHSLKGDKEKLTAAALDDIPDQLVTCFLAKGINPNPESEVEDLVIEPYSEDQDVTVPIQFSETGTPVVSGDAKPPEDKKKKDRFSQENITKELKKFGNKIGKRKIGMLKRKFRTDINKMSRATFGVSAI